MFYYSAGKTIEFRDVKDLKTVIQSHSVVHYKPHRLFTSSSPFVILYDVQAKSPREVQLLDCSGSEPKPVDGKNVICTKQTNISDMCVVQGGDRELLVATDGGKHGGRVCAYNTATDELEWSVKGKLEGMQKEMGVRGVTTDGRGHLFLCDLDNSCIQLFCTDGRYLGVLMRQGEHGLGRPFDIRWCVATSSLVVGHSMRRERYISFIKVQ